MLQKIIAWLDDVLAVEPPKPMTRYCVYCKKAFKTNSNEVQSPASFANDEFYHQCPQHCYRWVKLVQKKHRDSMDKFVL